MESDTYSLMRELEDSHWWFVARRAIIGTLIRRLRLPASAKLLEVGGGTGGNIGMLGAFGDLTCVEHDPAALALARERSGAPVVAGSLPDALPDFATSFDLVLALDVIEHVADDAAAVETLAAQVKPGGYVLITVPAFAFLWSQHDDENRHYRRYRKRDLQRLAAAAGLEPVLISYFNFWLFPGVALVRLWRKAFPYRSTWQDMRLPGRAQNAVLRTIFASERHLLGRVALPFGISLLAVLRRPPDVAAAHV